MFLLDRFRSVGDRERPVDQDPRTKLNMILPVLRQLSSANVYRVNDVPTGPLRNTRAIHGCDPARLKIPSVETDYPLSQQKQFSSHPCGRVSG